MGTHTIHKKYITKVRYENDDITIMMNDDVDEKDDGNDDTIGMIGNGGRRSGRWRRRRRRRSRRRRRGEDYIHIYARRRRRRRRRRKNTVTATKIDNQKRDQRSRDLLIF